MVLGVEIRNSVFLFLHMPRTLEHKIRINAILIYFVVSLICVGMVAYTYYIKADIKEQKERVSHYYEESILANRMIDKVNQAQIEVNRYVTTRQTKHYRAFQQNLSEVEGLIDTLRISAKDSSQYEILHEIKGLLREKGQIILQLNKHLAGSASSGKVDELMEQYTPAVQEVIVSTTVKDTLLQTVPKKGFFRKLTGLFSSDKDTLVTQSIVITDTVRTLKPDSIHLASEVSGIVEKVEMEYKNRLLNIERQVNRLINADHEISTKIYSSLIEFYDNILYNRWSEVQRSDNLVSENSTYSMISGGIALVLVLLFVILIFQDVNRAYTMRKLLEEANERTEQIMKSRHQLLLSVSHDVKTPLNSIMGNLELKEAGGRFAAEEVRSMENSGKHILTLLENLLNFSALEQGHLKKEEQKFFLNDFCRELCDMFHPLVKQKGLQFLTEFDFSADLFLQADELRLKQIVINVLSNAVKYTQSGSVKLEIDCHKGRLWCQITDTGVGIPKDQINSVFEPFLRIKEHATMAAGSGFGMYVVKGLVDLLDGSIRFSSEEAQGTQVTIIIPVKEVPVEKTDDSSKRILLIDDDSAFLSMLETMLHCLGHTVKACYSLAEFEKELLILDQYDVILTDMQMGTFSGKDILKKVRSCTAQIPVAVMTASSDYSEVQAKEQGFTIYLRKPVSISSLQQFVGGKQLFNMTSLNEMLENDAEMIQDVLTAFVVATEENLQHLQDALANKDIDRIALLAHKMLPMFLQVGDQNTSSALEKMEKYRGRSLQELSGWEYEVKTLIENAGKVIAVIKEQHLTDSN